MLIGHQPMIKRSKHEFSPFFCVFHNVIQHVYFQINPFIGCDLSFYNFLMGFENVTQNANVWSLDIVSQCKIYD